MASDLRGGTGAGQRIATYSSVSHQGSFANFALEADRSARKPLPQSSQNVWQRLQRAFTPKTQAAG